MFETRQTRQPLICFHVYGIMAYRVQHTRWSVQRNSIAVQMLNLGILEFWNFGILEFWNLWVLESLDCGIVTRDLESLVLGTITGILTGILESWDYGSLAGVFAVFATSIPSQRTITQACDLLQQWKQLAICYSGGNSSAAFMEYWMWHKSRRKNLLQQWKQPSCIYGVFDVTH